MVTHSASCAQTPLMSSQEPRVAQHPGDPLASPRRDQQDLGAVPVLVPAGLPPWVIRIRIGERCPSFADTPGLGVQEKRPGSSTAPMRLVTESFFLFSPRTSESPCTGTKRSPGICLSVLQEAFGEGILGGRCSQRSSATPPWTPPISCSLLRPFWICVGRLECDQEGENGIEDCKE